MLSIFYQNIGRARSKVKDIQLSLLDSNYDIVCLTETNFDRGVYDNEFVDNRYNVFRRDRESSCSSKQSGGGALIAVKNNINVIRQSSWESIVEEIWLTIISNKPGDSTLHICLCYLPPDLSIDNVGTFYDNCQRVILNVAPGDDFVVLGDFNAANITWSKQTASTSLIPLNPQDRRACFLLETMDLCNLSQFNSIPN